MELMCNTLHHFYFIILKRSSLLFKNWSIYFIYQKHPVFEILYDSSWSFYYCLEGFCCQTLCFIDWTSTSFFFFNYFIVQLQLSAFFPHPSTPPQPNPPPSPASTLPLGFVHVSFILLPENPSPHCPFPRPLWLLLDYS